MKTRLLLVFALLPVACARPPDGEPERPVEPASTVFVNGAVYTVDDRQPWASAVAVAGADIVYEK